MKILVLRSSGSRKGSSNLLADEFIRGAKESGNEITEFNMLQKEVRPCLGCNMCGMNSPCVQKDDFEKELKGLIRSADMIVFAMPVYYYGWPAQMKAVVDRFYSFNGELTRMQKKTVLLTVAWDNSDSVFDFVDDYYKRLCDYMHFENCGSILGKGCGTLDMTKESHYPGAAYELGKSFT